MEVLRHDLRFAVRTLIRNPAFTAVVVVTLGLGIGVNSAIFSSVYSVLVRPLPFVNPGELIELQLEPEAQASRATLTRLWDRLQHIDDVAGWTGGAVTLTGLDQPERLSAGYVTGNLLALLGTQAEVGRTLMFSDGDPGVEPVTVLSHALWEQSFGMDEELVGESIVLDGTRHTVVGVMPPSFQFPAADAKLWIPSAIDPPKVAEFNQEELRLVGRMASEATVEQATVELRRVGQDLRELYPDYARTFGNQASIRPLREALVGDTRTALLVLFGAVGFVLLIVCANVANLLLTRSATRQREMAIRTALGAGRRRVIRQLLTESLVLALLGGVVGLFLAAWTAELLGAALPPEIPGAAEVGVGRAVLAFTFGLSVLAGILFGMAPAVLASSDRVRRALRDGGRTTGGTYANARNVFGALMVSEVAMALVLVAGAGLMIQSFWRLSLVDPGFEAESVLTLRLSPDEDRYAEPQDRWEYWDRIVREVSAVPGVRSTAASQLLPFSGTNSTSSIDFEDQPVLPGDAPPQIDVRIVTPNLFNTLGIPLLNGRTFTDQDRSATEAVAIINNTMARRFFRGQDPIGKRIRTDWEDEGRWLKIVGIVADTRDQTLAGDPRAQLYRPHGQRPVGSMALMVKTRGDPALLAPPLRAVIWGVDEQVPISIVRPLSEVVAQSVAQPRLFTALLVLFGALALILGAVGIYGVMSFAVSQRSTEIGVRIAFGAGSGTVLRQVLREAFALVGAGLALGLVGALALTRVMANQLYQVEPGDPLTLTAVVGILALVGLGASYLPSRRASRIDPMEALRTE